MVVAHNGEDHGTESNAAMSDAHTGHVQGSTTTQDISFSEGGSANNQRVLFLGGTALLVLAAAVAVWLLRSRRAAPEAVTENSTE